MKLASYRSSQEGIKGLANRIIRWRLSGPYSHSEAVFIPGDGVDDLMPDGTCAPLNGAYWCASSVATDRMPAWSKRRAGHIGGVRFKRIVLDPRKWDLQPLQRDARSAAQWFSDNEGAPYDWQLILGYLAWFIPQKSGRATCSEACAAAFGIADPWRYDPCLLASASLLISLPPSTRSGGFFNAVKDTMPAIETTSAGAGALIKIFGVPLLFGAAGAALSFLFMWPKTRREAFIRFTCSIATSALLGPPLVFALHSWWPSIFESARAVLVLNGADPALGMLALAGPIMVLAGLPAWWVLGAIVLWLERRRGKDIGELAHDAVEVVKDVRGAL